MSQTTAKQALLKSQLRGHGLQLRWNSPDETILEAFLSRGDRRLGKVIRRAWGLGDKFDAWQEQHKPEAWKQSFAEARLSIGFYTHRPRPVRDILPWDPYDVD